MRCLSSRRSRLLGAHNNIGETVAKIPARGSAGRDRVDGIGIPATGPATQSFEFASSCNRVACRDGGWKLAQRTTHEKQQRANRISHRGSAPGRQMASGLGESRRRGVGESLRSLAREGGLTPCAITKIQIQLSGLGSAGEA